MKILFKNKLMNTLLLLNNLKIIKRKLIKRRKSLFRKLKKLKIILRKMKMSRIKQRVEFIRKYTIRLLKLKLKNNMIALIQRNAIRWLKSKVNLLKLHKVILRPKWYKTTQRNKNKNLSHVKVNSFLLI